MAAPQLNVLLLGWDEPQVPTTPDSPPSPRALTQALLPTGEVAVLLPTLPAAAYPAAAHVTGIGNVPLPELTAALEADRQRHPHPDGWEAPAAPYQGATPPAPYQGASDAAPAAPAPTLLNEDPTLLAGEPDAAEAADLHQLDPGPSADAATPPLDEEVPAAPASPSLLPASAERATPAHALAALRQTPTEGDLNFRVIQYARFATPLALQQPFEVIYASAWPTWLAALEIRQRTGRPLVLHVHSLAQDRSTPDDRGWGQALERLALRRADVVLVESEDMCQRIRHLYGLPLRRMRVQPLHASPEEITRTVQTTLQELAGLPT